MDKTVSLHPGGTTSACAENTRKNTAVFTRPRNYLRVRGEYLDRDRTEPVSGELPPRARRIHQPGTASVRIGGTTSACAENTGFGRCGGAPIRNYLRVRGEYPPHGDNLTLSLELPPRARRIPAALVIAAINAGTTSACAENTFSGCI